MVCGKMSSRGAKGLKVLKKQNARKAKAKADKKKKAEKRKCIAPNCNAHDHIVLLDLLDSVKHLDAYLRERKWQVKWVICK